MGASTITLQNLVDDASSSAELAPALSTGGWSDQPAIQIANDVMADMVNGGPDGQPLNWKWNRIMVPAFYTNQYQQDYAISAFSNLAWIEYAEAVDINSTSIPKRTFPLEVKRDLRREYRVTSTPTKICWLYNYELIWATRGGSNDERNPQPGDVYTNPLGAATAPDNHYTQITDPNGNLLVMTQYGTLHSGSISWPASSATAGTTVTDGTAIWTVVDSNAIGFRLSPVPQNSGTVWQINVIGQKKPVVFSSLSQTLAPLPDDYARFFKQGFWAQCIRRSPDAKVRAKFVDEYKLWMKALDNAIKAGDREPDDTGFYPGNNLMSGGGGEVNLGPCYPFGSPWSY